LLFFIRAEKAKRQKPPQIQVKARDSASPREAANQPLKENPPENLREETATSTVILTPMIITTDSDKTQ